jgi:hypothetical protein
LRPASKQCRGHGYIDPRQLHLTISGLGFHYISNRHTFSQIFELGMESPTALPQRREIAVDLVLRWCRRTLKQESLAPDPSDAASTTEIPLLAPGPTTVCMPLRVQLYTRTIDGHRPADIHARDPWHCLLHL